MFNKKAQSGSVYLVFLLFLLVPIIVFFAAPLLGFIGSWSVSSTELSGANGLIIDNLNFILFLCFVLFIVLWNK